MTKKEDDKMNIGIKINKHLWRAFRIRSIQDGTKMGEMIEKWVAGYLKRAPKDETPEKEPENDTPEPRRIRPSRSDFDRDKGGNKK